MIGNLSDKRCGFANFTQQTITALQRAGHDVGSFDGTYEQVYARQQQGVNGFLPPNAASYDIVHVIWHAMTLNHYSGCDWTGLKTSWWDGGPSDATCPFKDAMQIRWSDYPREGYHYLHYPVPDWVTDLPAPDAAFTVGASSVRGDGIAAVQELCESHGWAMNLPTGAWVPLDEEVRRLARSTVNVCWYRTPPLWHNRASAPSMLLASGRPLLIDEDALVAHLFDASDVYHGAWGHLDEALWRVWADWQEKTLTHPTATAEELSWTRAARELARVWATA